MENLSDIPLFASMDREAGERLGKSCLWKDYDAHELVIDVDEETTDVRFIITGLVRIISRFSVGKEVILSEMGPGQFFGELAAIDSGARSANVTALTNARLCIMPSAVFNSILDESHEVTHMVMRKLVTLVRTLSERLSEFTFLQAKHRICSELYRMSKDRRGHHGQRIISPPPLQRDIADRVSSRREVVSREMTILERDGVIEKSKGGLIILDPEELKRRSREI